MNTTTKYPSFASESEAIQYCTDKLIDLELAYGAMIKSGHAYGGSEIDADYKSGIIPSDYTIIACWAEFVQINHKGNPINRTVFIKAIYPSY